MLNAEPMEAQEPRRQVDVALAEGLEASRVGVLVLLEVGSPVGAAWPALVEALETVLPPRASVHSVSDELLAMVVPGRSLFDGWSLVETSRALFATAGVPVSVGLSSWPMEGPTVTDVFGAAVASLVDDRARARAPAEEECVEFDGLELAFHGAGDFLSA
jgi:hypothetical protein